MALAPAQSTLTVMIRKVLNYIVAINDSEIDQVATDAINDAIDQINEHNWNKNIKQASVSFVADQRTYDMPTDFRAPRAMMRWNSSDEDDGRVPYKPLKSLLNEHVFSNNSGDPAYYTTDEQARKIMLDTVPNAAFVASWPKYNLWYHFNQAHLATGSATIDLAASFERFIVWHARASVSAFRRPQIHKFAADQADRAWMALRANDHDEMTDWA